MIQSDKENHEEKGDTSQQVNDSEPEGRGSMHVGENVLLK